MSGTTAYEQRLITFCSNATASGNTTPKNVPFSEGLLIAQGVWGGATVTVFQSSPDGNYVPLFNLTQNVISLTSDTAVPVGCIVQNQLMYVNIAGATGTTNLTVTLQRTH